MILSEYHGLTENDSSFVIGAKELNTYYQILATLLNHDTLVDEPTHDNNTNSLRNEFEKSTYKSS